jgi:hypothetical protein
VAGARHVVALMAAGDHLYAVQRYFRYSRLHMLPHRPAANLRVFWEQLTRRLGPLRRVVRATTRLRHGQRRTVTLRCQFERGQAVLDLPYRPRRGRVFRFLGSPSVNQDN